MATTDAIIRLNAALRGRYRIERQLGEGGMATVYLADDLRHEREVALKVLKPELAAVVGADRFLAEIKTTAKLQHPHILPLFDSGEAASFLFYVMPYVEGESLRERLERDHQLPVEEAVRIAIDVAEALDYAHSRGVIHRDIKPANILLQAGKPVVADFGIALALGAAGTGRLTETGLSLGTPHYMSPEQATGDMSVGASTDIYALGCVLYEMLVGEPPYVGSTPQAILGKIIAGQPVSAATQRATVPTNVDASIRMALEKVPADRFRCAQDFAKALSNPAFRHGAASVPSAGARPTWNRLSIGLASLAAVLALALAWSVGSSPGASPGPPARFDVTPAGDQRLATGSDLDVALSPDGARMVYRGVASGGGPRLWRRDLDELTAAPIPGTEDASGPSLSPDGSSVAFLAGGAVRTVSLEGGPPVTITTSGGQSFSTAWGSDGMIYYSRDNVIYRVLATGGEPEPVTVPMQSAIQRFPSPLPGGRGILLTVTRGITAQARIAVAGPDGGEVREILTGTMARYAPTGHLVYATADGTLLAAPFDVQRLEVTGPSVTLVEGVAVEASAASQFAMSESGTLLYGAGAGAVSVPVWVSRSGQVEPVDPTWTGEFAFPALSPEGSRIALSMAGEGSTDLWVKQLDRGPLLKLTFEGGRNDYPIWTPDGRSVTFVSDRAGPSTDLWTKRADGSAQAELQLDRERGLAEPEWSRDGSWLVYRTFTTDPGAGDILALHVGEDAAPVPIVATDFQERGPTLSPDARWMAYMSDETGRNEIYVVPFPNAGEGKWAVSAGGGTEPLWSRSGRELFYRDAQGDMVSVRVETEPTFSAGPTSVLFSAAGFQANSNRRQYDVDAADERFIMLRPVGGDAQSELILVLNFSAELARLLPG